MPAIQSSAMMPSPSGKRSNCRAGGGLVMSNSRCSRKPAKATAHESIGMRKNVIGRLAISSSTMQPGSLAPPSRRAAAEQIGTPKASRSPRSDLHAVGAIKSPTTRPAADPAARQTCPVPTEESRSNRRWPARPPALIARTVVLGVGIGVGEGIAEHASQRRTRRQAGGGCPLEPDPCSSGEVI